MISKSAIRFSKSNNPVFSFLAVLLLGAAFVEGGFRLFFPPLQSVRVATYDVNRWETDGGSLYMGGTRGLRLRPITQARIENHRISGLTTEVRTNSFGFRGSEIGPKVPGRKRVLFLGDSITLADYIPENQTFVSLVGELSQLSSPAYETINGGIGAAGLEDYLSVLEETGSAAHPDVIVIDLFLNDYKSSPTTHIFHPPFFFQNLRFGTYLFEAFSSLHAQFWSSDERALAPEVVQRWADELQGNIHRLEPGVSHRFQTKLLNAVFDWGGAWTAEGWEMMREYLEKLRLAVQTKRIPLFVVLFPVREQVEERTGADLPQRRVIQYSLNNNLPVLDLLPRLRETHTNDGDKLFYDHCHLTPRGNRVVAEAIFDFLGSGG